MEGLSLERGVVRNMAKPSAEPSTGKAVKPENVKYIGSYNWVEEVQPTIIVPGMCIVSLGGTLCSWLSRFSAGMA